MVEIRADQIARLGAPTLLSRTQTLFAHGGRAPSFARTRSGSLDFGFKPLRMIRLVDPSAESGQRLVWYLVYRVKNPGEGLPKRRKRCLCDFATE